MHKIPLYILTLNMIEFQGSMYASKKKIFKSQIKALNKNIHLHKTD